MNIHFKKITGALIAGLFSCYSLADWHLTPADSSINFISVKKEHLVETHTFKNFSASITEQGQVNLSIDLTSVATNIAIRDQRMKDHLFNTSLFPKATFSAQLNTKMLTNLPSGTSENIDVTGEINLHGQKQTVTLKVLITKLTTDKLLVVNQAPLIISAEDFDLIAGINKLQSLANLPSITHRVPVNFILTFTHQ
ncbi:YceI family protein [Thalassotalea sp. SU-HH00458]|uniref:YceI family protein n=1 Tax=Thalassotalea sp. SU-HH00458 TaxID=3127657 RepID=UPI003108083B